VSHLLFEVWTKRNLKYSTTAKAMRHILCILKWQHVTTRLTHENLKNKMDYIVTIEEVINEQKLVIDWLGNITRQSNNLPLLG
jgi:hypothetical protein